MICPNCQKPYFFLKKDDPQKCACLKCQHEGVFSAPDYDGYLEGRYFSKKYRRDKKTDPQMKKILETLAIKKDDKVLELGCGAGDYAKEVAKLAGSYVGLDADVSKISEKYPNAEFLSHDCNKKLPLDDKDFDVVFSVNLIEHLVDSENFLQECSRVLKKEGKIAIVTANLDFFLHNFFYDQTHLHEWSPNEFKKMLEKHFEVSLAEKNSAMFNYYPWNLILTKIIKPDMLFVGKKK